MDSQWLVNTKSLLDSTNLQYDCMALPSQLMAPYKEAFLSKRWELMFCNSWISQIRNHTTWLHRHLSSECFGASCLCGWFYWYVCNGEPWPIAVRFFWFPQFKGTDHLQWYWKALPVPIQWPKWISFVFQRNQVAKWCFHAWVFWEFRFIIAWPWCLFIVCLFSLWTW